MFKASQVILYEKNLFERGIAILVDSLPDVLGAGYVTDAEIQPIVCLRIWNYTWWERMLLHSSPGIKKDES